MENFKKVHLISREEFDCLTPEPPVDPNQEVPPGPPRPQQSKDVNAQLSRIPIRRSHRDSKRHPSSVPTDALANKLFGAPEPSSIARSLPTTVPDSPNYRSARTPRTPRTPHRKDQTMTPRFYPVVKESRPVDAKVGHLPTCGETFGPLLADACSKDPEISTHCRAQSHQTPRKRKTRHSSNPPMECHVGWVMDSREHRSRTASVRLVCA